VVLWVITKSGKTTLRSHDDGRQVIDRRGTVEAKNTYATIRKFEQLFKDPFIYAFLYKDYEDHKLNFIDTRALTISWRLISAFRVADSGVMLVNGQHGVEVGQEIFSVMPKSITTHFSCRQPAGS
jgi:elongation factor G